MIAGSRAGAKEPPPAPSSRAIVEIGIESIGSRGDGIGRIGDRPVYVAYAVPGERVRAEIVAARGEGLVARLIEVVEPGPLRAAPPCPHFGVCGGCVLQHVAAAAYADWKQDQVATALKRRGVVAQELRPLARVAPGTRRRATFMATRRKDQIVLGFHERASHRIVDLTTCLVLMPELTRLLSPLRAALASALPAGGSAAVAATWTDSGADLLVVCDAPLHGEAKAAMSALAEAADLARVSWGRPGGTPEPVTLRRRVRVMLGGVPVDVPPGSFLQPSAAGEALLTAAVLNAVAPGGAIADLFCGCGTFAIPLCRRGMVHAADSAADAVGALAEAARRAGLAGRIATERRDLMRDPLSPVELARFRAVVFDPPRAGARAQAACLARSPVATVVAVSCDPATFARDARILIDGGYALGAVTPVDQFPWSPHVELVAVFRRSEAKG